MKLPLNPPATVLGVAAHPDDIDFGAGGTVARLAAGGATVYYLILTDGSKGSANRSVVPRQLIDTRRHEQQLAAKRLGVKKVYFLDYEDGTLECQQEVKCDITRYIRQLRPDLVITMDPTLVYSVKRGSINHPDHRMAGQATLDAVYPLARDHLSFPELLAEGLEPHKVLAVWLINFDEHNHFIDISEYLAQKIEALQAHQSQVSDHSEIEQTVRSLAAAVGQDNNCDWAEAFVRIEIA